MIKFNLSVLVCIFLFSVFSTKAQTLNDSILLIKGKNTIQYQQYDQPLDFKRLKFALMENKEAYKTIKNAKAIYNLGYTIGSIGSGLIGYSCGYGMTSGYLDFRIIAVGLGLCIITIPINNAVKSKTQLAVDIYNSQIKPEETDEPLSEFKIGPTADGIGLTFTF